MWFSTPEECARAGGRWWNRAYSVVMNDSRHRRTEEGFRRLITFTDAVVAIAMTLLILPLVDVGHDLTGGMTVADVFSEHSEEIIGFLISFVVIWVLWRHHHSMMEDFKSYDRVLLDLTAVWLATIVVLPVVTALISGSHIEWASVCYMGVLWVSIATLTAMSLWGRRHRELLDDGPEVDQWVAGPPDLATLILLTCALVVAVVIPSVGLWSLVLLFASTPLTKVVDRLWRNTIGAGRA